MLKVLLVDDEPFILQGLKLLVDWEKEGFRVAGTAANGMEALAFLKKEKVDLVIADIKMPQMTGLELLEHIRKEKISDAYFVILSGYAEFSFAQQAMQNDCTDYLLKPVDSEILCKVLNKVLALHNREELDHEKNRIHVFCTVKTEGKTGVEMEALTGVQVTLLTIYDMCKAIDKHMVMSEIHLIEKTGGKSGDFRFEDET